MCSQHQGGKIIENSSSVTQLYSQQFLCHICYCVSLLATCFHAGILLGLIFDPEDGGDMFLRYVGRFSTVYMALYLHDRRYENLKSHKIKISFK
jgi:hypothetical protein